MTQGRKPAANEAPPNPLRDGLGRLGGRYLESLRWWARWAEGLQQIARRPGDVAGMLRRGAAFARQESTAALNEQARLYLDHWVAAVDVGMNVANRLLQSVFWPDGRQESDRAARGGSGAAPPATGEQPRRTQLLFEEEFGRAASRSFAVSNRTEERRSVRFEVSEFIREDRKERFQASIAFSPAEFALEPGEHRVVRCDLVLAEPFTAGLTHVAFVRVAGFPGMELAVVASPRPGRAGEKNA